MLGSVGFGELLLIGLVALIVFGPRRLPEIARRAGELMAKARTATKELTDSLDAEYEGATAPLADLQGEYQATKDQITDTTSKLTELTSIPDATIAATSADDQESTATVDEQQGQGDDSADEGGAV